MELLLLSVVTSFWPAHRFGVFGFGAYPLALELSVEATYPIDEAAGTALIFLSGQVVAQENI